MILPELMHNNLNCLTHKMRHKFRLWKKWFGSVKAVDMLERRLTKLGASMSEDSEIGTVNDSETKTKLERREVRSGNVLIEVLNIMGASLLLLVSLFSADGYLRDNEIALAEQVRA